MSFMRKFNIRLHQFNWQEGQCCWCGEPMEFVLPCHARGDNWDAATIEHVVPRTAGGSSSRKNTLLSHRRCNLKRGHDQSMAPLFTPFPTPERHRPS